MYKLLLISKYLRRKLAPLFAAVAVMLCTMMVIIVMSVMGGFLELLRESAHRLTGDLVVTAGQLRTFPYYEELADRLEALPEIEQATPVIRTFGLLQFQGQPVLVEVMGIRPEEYDRVVEYRESLYWDNDDMLDRFSGALTPDQLPRLVERLEGNSITEAGMQLAPQPWMAAAERGQTEGIVIGIEVNPWALRDEQGQYRVSMSAILEEVRLTVVPFGASRSAQEMKLNAAEPTLVVVNEFKSGLYDVDDMRVYVRFEALQRWLMMDETAQAAAGDDPFAEAGTVPAQTTELMVKAAPGVTADQALLVVKPVVDQFQLGRLDVPPLFTWTWEMRHSTLLSAVQNEKGMVSFLFIVISAVAVVMVATTFYMIVLEKTRDIGVLRAMGASRIGLLGLFLGYGLAIGTVGAGLGMALGVTTVHYLNELQHFLSTYLGATAHIVGSAAGGALLGAVIGVVIGFLRQDMGWWVARLTPVCCLLMLLPSVAAVGLLEDYRAFLNATIRFEMWNPQTYYFDAIPNRVDYVEVVGVVLGAIASSVIGAIIPALIAASRDPVEALRYE